jgi:lipopolysaccharide/colanic/teichoic acid biosynthesis glycosyltransferase
MPKFRSMRTDAPQAATQLVGNPRANLTSTGGFLRRRRLDELSQLFSASGGELSLGGPHSVLFNQDDLIALRTKPGVNGLRPIFGPGTVISGGRERTLLAETTPKALRWVTIVDLRMKLRFRSSPPRLARAQ